MLDAMLLIRTPDHFLPEKKYVFEVLLDDWLGIPFRLETSQEPDYQLVLPNGNRLVVRDRFFSKIKSHPFFTPENLPTQAENATDPLLSDRRLTVIFGESNFYFRDTEILCGLDFFASAFFMLTRWEEHALPDRDAHGRFPARASLAVRSGFPDRPVVNEYADLLFRLLQKLGWPTPRKPRQFALQLSHDVDHPRLWWSPADRLRTLAGSIFRRGDLRETAYFLKNFTFSKTDPFDTFDALMDISERAGCVSHFNFLGERQPDSDAFYPLRHPFVLDLLKKIDRRGHRIGFHPSYEAFDDAEKFASELASLRALTPQPVLTGRQHYLRFAAPDTWQVWDDAGMAWDSSLGYSEVEGFRCGACYDFPVFNFKTRKKLALREKPLLAMDVTLAIYRRLTPEQCLENLEKLRSEVRRHGGEFTLLWHNSSWNTYFWAGYREVYRRFVESFWS